MPVSPGCIPDAPGETGIHLEWKQRSPLCSRVATGISGSSLGGHKAPEEQVGLSHYEMLYDRPFVCVNELFLDPEAQTLWSYTMAIGQFQQDICLWGVNQDPKNSKVSPLNALEI